MRTRLPLGFLTLFALIAFAGLAACGDDDDDSARSNDAGDNGSSSEKPGASGDGSLSGSGADSLRKLARDATKKTYVADYEFEGEDEEGKKQTGKMVIANKPPRSAFNVTTTDADGVTTVFISFEDQEFSFICTREGNGDGQCLKTRAEADNPLSGAFDINSLLNSLETGDSARVTEIKGQKIAGQESKCYTIEDASGKGTACFAKESGIVTLIDSADGGSLIKLKATKVSEKVDDALFSPPADWEVTDLTVD
jgi:hypothetical protein